jgi:hypothetical protein
VISRHSRPRVSKQLGDELPCNIKSLHIRVKDWEQQPAAQCVVVSSCPLQTRKYKSLSRTP